MDNVSLRKHELRMLAAKADLQELDLSTRRRELVSIADVEKRMTDLVITTRARIVALPARLAPELLCETSRVTSQAKIEKALKESLAQLSSKADANALLS